jgi:membrane protein YqaA with SNARE-associated domain
MGNHPLKPECRPLKTLARHLYLFLAHFGGLGLLGLGVLDSSFLFVPFGNDLLMIAMTSKKHDLMIYYASMATAGSLLGCLAIDVLCRKGGESGLESYISQRRLRSVRKHINQDAPWALAIAAIMPPPFPFTPFVGVAAALQYPRKKLFATIGAVRFLRFSIEGTLAIFMGERFIQLAQVPVVQGAVVCLAGISVIGSALSVRHWIVGTVGRRSRR